jgi:hypothetical protein
MKASIKINNINLTPIVDLKTKTLINPSVFLDSGVITGPVLESSFTGELSPWFLTGFIDAEGNFDISVFSNARALAETGIKFRFRISSNYKDIVLLCAIRNYFNNGTISIIRKDTEVVTLEISSIEIIEKKIIPFLDNYPLKGTKYYDYQIWRIHFFYFLVNRSTLNSKLLLIERLKLAQKYLVQKNKKLLNPITVATLLLSPLFFIYKKKKRESAAQQQQINMQR